VVAVAMQYVMASGKTSKLIGNNQLAASQQFAAIAMIAATAKQQITTSGQWQQSRGASGGVFFYTSSCVAVSNGSVL